MELSREPGTWDCRRYGEKNNDPFLRCDRDYKKGPFLIQTNYRNLNENAVISIFSRFRVV